MVLHDLACSLLQCPLHHLLHSIPAHGLPWTHQTCFHLGFSAGCSPCLKSFTLPHSSHPHILAELADCPLGHSSACHVLTDSCLPGSHILNEFFPQATLCHITPFLLLHAAYYNPKLSSLYFACSPVQQDIKIEISTKSPRKNRCEISKLDNHRQNLQRRASLVKNPPSNAGDVGLIPNPRQLSLWATTAEACMPRACAPQEKATTMRSLPTTTREEPGLAATRESRRAATKTMHNQNYMNK